MKKNSSDTSAIVATIKDFLKENHESGTLHDVAQQLNEIVTKTHEATEITVTSVVPMTEHELTQLHTIMHKLVKHDLPIVQRVDRSLIGGFTIRIQDWFFDVSIASHIHDMKRRLLA